MSLPIVFKLKTLTPIWTGGVDIADRVHETGIRGSLRWWYEALIRGLGGYACDPTEDRRCELDQKRFKEIFNNTKDIQSALDEQICPACQLFGCGGWAAKFRMEIRSPSSDFIDTLHKEADVEKGFDIRFVETAPLRPITNYERWLLHKTLWLIVTYGSIGGRTTRKPQANPRRSISGPWGLIEFHEKPQIEDMKEDVKGWFQRMLKTSSGIKTEIGKKAEKVPDTWPNLNYFFFKPGHFLNRNQINQLFEGNVFHSEDEKIFFIGGRGGRQEHSISKKIFSFNHPRATRFWGYCRNEAMLNNVLKYLKVKEKFGVSEIKKGIQVIADEL